MPRITIEKKIKITNKVFEIKTATYELPDSILYKNKVLDYDNYHRRYIDRKSNTYISAEDYLKIALNNKKKNNSSI